MPTSGSSYSTRRARRLRGRDVLARPDIVRDAGEVERLLGIMTTVNPMVGRFIPIPKGPDGNSSRSA